MKLALFVGCVIPSRRPELERTSRAVLERLGVELVDLPFGCCGYPERHLRLDAFLWLAAGNLALAGTHGLNILTLCQCCYGNLRHAQHLLRREPRWRDALGARLADDGLTLRGDTEVRHLLDVLARDVGAEQIAARVVAPQSQLQTAAHYGCHALRPSNVVALDNPNAPAVFERLLAAAGARPVDWPRRLDCCGAAIAPANPVLAGRLRTAKLADALESGANLLCTACPHCQSQLGLPDASPELPVMLYADLLARALGVDRARPRQARPVPAPSVTRG